MVPDPHTRNQCVNTSTGAHASLLELVFFSLGMEASWQIEVGWITVFFDVASVVTCVWLLWTVGSPMGKLLLPVPLVNLALANVLFASMEVVLTARVGACFH